MAEVSLCQDCIQHIEKPDTETLESATCLIYDVTEIEEIVAMGFSDDIVVHEVPKEECDYCDARDEYPG